MLLNINAFHSLTIVITLSIIIRAISMPVLILLNSYKYLSINVVSRGFWGHKFIFKKNFLSDCLDIYI
jgi:hypothetical protein